MALLKIYTNKENRGFLIDAFAKSAKQTFASALDCPQIPTSEKDIELVYGEGIDLSGIDFIIEIVACKRPKLQEISQQIIDALNQIHPDKSFSVYFNLIEEEGMANTPRSKS